MAYGSGSLGRDDTIAVLHVDDEPDWARLVENYLERIDGRLSVAIETDPDGALDRIREGEFDAVVSDYDMPRTTGLELLKEVRALDPELPFILYTGKGSEEVASEAISNGVSDYLQKGTSPEQYEVLANRVTNAVERYRATRQAELGYEAMNVAWDGISILDPDGRFTYVNEAHAALFGYEPAELVGERWSVCYPEGQRQKVYDEILPAARAAGTWTGETTLKRADGTEFVGAHAVARLDDDGGAVCVLRDLTERRELDRELRHERQRFRLLVEAVEQYAIVMLDEEGCVASWNDGAERIAGHAEEDVLGQHVSIFYTDEDVQSGLPDRLLGEAAESGHATTQGPRVREDGSTFWADVSITAIYEDGRLRGYAEVTEDISKEHERQRRQERNERFRQCLYFLVSDTRLEFVEKLRFLLQLGAERLDVDNGIITRIDPDTRGYEVVEVGYDGRQAVRGETAALDETFCRRAITSDEVLGIQDTSTDEWADDPATGRWEMGCYLGSKLLVDDELFGTVCFIDAEPRSAPFDHADRAFVDLVGRWLSVELHHHGGADALG